MHNNFKDVHNSTQHELKLIGKNSYFSISYSSHKGSFNNYVDMKGWVGGQSNVYAHKVNDLFLFTSIVYKGWVGGQKSPKFCLRSYWMVP